ncbi:MAG: fumarylacetoacetate hydrolase family protein, partial [Woeseiaceae bacterium]
MKLLTYIHNGTEQVGVRRDDDVIPLRDLSSEFPESLLEILAQDQLDAVREAFAKYDGDGVPVSAIQYQTLIPRPGKVVCIGRNYAAHAKEGGVEPPTFPEVFMRGAMSLLPHQGEIVRPQCSTKLDFEGEIAFIIGKTCRHATADEALGYVAGYSLFHDATLRDYQKFSSQWTVGKNFDSTGAFGPELVTADELPEGVAGLALTTRLNGELMQEG